MRAGFLGVLAMLAAGYTLLAFQLDPFGPAGSPGPGFLPRVLGIALLLALLPDVRGVLWARGAAAAPREALSVSVVLPHGRIAVAIGTLALLLVGLSPVLGTVPTSALFLFVSLGILNPGSHRWNGFLSLAVPAALYVVFTLWLGVRLPAGVFARWF